MEYLPASHRKYRKCECDIKNAVAAAKENWILKTPQAAGVDSDDCSQWQCFKQLQMVYHGRQSMRNLAVLDENCHLLLIWIQ